MHLCLKIPLYSLSALALFLALAALRPYIYGGSGGVVGGGSSTLNSLLRQTWLKKNDLQKQKRPPLSAADGESSSSMNRGHGKDIYPQKEGDTSRVVPMWSVDAECLSFLSSSSGDGDRDVNGASPPPSSPPPPPSAVANSSSACPLENEEAYLAAHRPRLMFADERESESGEEGVYDKKKKVFPSLRTLHAHVLEPLTIHVLVVFPPGGSRAPCTTMLEAYAQRIDTHTHTHTYSHTHTGEEGGGGGGGGKSGGKTGVVPAQVRGKADGSYVVTIEFGLPGRYELKVSVLWEGFQPGEVILNKLPCGKCPETEPLRSEIFKLILVEMGTEEEEEGEEEGGEEEVDVTAAGEVVPPRTFFKGKKEKHPPSTSHHLPTPTTTTTILHPCKTMTDLLNGMWLLPPSSPSPPNDTHTHTIWRPHSCQLLPSFEPSVLRRVFVNKHIHFMGDSTMHELMGIIMEMFYIERTEEPQVVAPPCNRTNRIYDSHIHEVTHTHTHPYTTRFSFKWTGGPRPCDDLQGLPSLLQDKDKNTDKDKEELFLSSVTATGQGADFVVFNGGAHDAAGNVGLREYHDAMSGLFDAMLGSDAGGEKEEEEEGGKDGEDGGSTRGRQRHGEQQHQQPRHQHPHFIVRTTHPFGKPCFFKGGNAKVQWLNHMAQLQAQAYDFTLMDSYRLFFTEDRLRDGENSRGGRRAANISFPSSCGDGLHCSKKYVTEKDDQQKPAVHCRKCLVQAQILLQYLFFQMVGRE